MLSWLRSKKRTNNTLASTRKSVRRQPQRPVPPASLDEIDFTLFAEYTADTRVERKSSDSQGVDAACAKIVDYVESNAGDIQGFPSNALRLSTLAEDDDATIEDFVSAINQDPALAFRVLRLANSAHFRRQREIDSIRDAVVLLGIRNVSNLALAASLPDIGVKEDLGELPSYRVKSDEMVQNAMACAFSSAWYARELRVGDPDRAFLGGLLHNIGGAIALNSLAAFHRQETPIVLNEAELDTVLIRVLGTLGQAIVAFWQFPAFLAEICGQVHAESPSPSDGHCPELHLVRLATSLQSIANDPGYLSAREHEVLASMQALDITTIALQRMHTEASFFNAGDFLG